MGHNRHQSCVHGDPVGVMGGDASFSWRVNFGILLHYWLFWFAFPWLGELP
jgi:hypothetical protein